MTTMMLSDPTASARRRAVPRRWIHVGVAALAMVATLPGRTHGLGLFTEPILRDFGLDRADYGLIGLAGTLLGALFCLPCGWLTDRVGTRAVLVGTMGLLAVAVFGLAAWTGGIVGLFLLILLTRGFGQSALSVASLTLIGRSARDRTGLAMGLYSFLTSVGFLGAFILLRSVVTANPGEWRGPWTGIGVGVLAIAIASALLVRNRALDADAADPTAGAEPSRTLGQALRSGAFWVFALGTSLYGLVGSGTSLFNESILAERGFGKAVFLNVSIVGIPVGLAANLLGGWLATKIRLGRLFAGAMALLAITLTSFPFVVSEPQVYTYARGLAASGGIITVCFFSVWRRLYGPAALGRIQGAAQLLTVLASGIGQALFPAVKGQFGEYPPLFLSCAPMALALAAFAWFVRADTPSPSTFGAER